MKRLSLILCTFIFILSSCGIKPASNSEVGSTQRQSLATEDVDISISGELLGNYIIQKTTSDSSTTISRYDLDGNLVNQINLPFARLEDSAQAESIDLWEFGADCLWVVRAVTTVSDEEQEQQDTGVYYLEKYDFNSTKLVNIEIQESPVSMGISEDDVVVLVTMDNIFFYDAEGKETGSCTTNQDLFCVCYGTGGEIYLQNKSQRNVSILNCSSYEIGSELFTYSDDTTEIFPGNETCNFFIKTDTALAGLCSDEDQVSLLLWSDYGIEGCVASLSAIENDELLVCYYDPITYSVSYIKIMLDQTVLNSNQEKQEIILAVGIINEVPDWSNAVSSQMSQAIMTYNQRSDLYEITPVAFQNETELQLMLTSEEIDMIYWGDTALQQDDSPSVQTYAAKGYLADLESLELDTSDFISRIIELDKKTYGGLYTLPMSFYARTLIGKSDYVGTTRGWSLEDMLEIAQQLPDDVVLYSGLTQLEFLEFILDCAGSDFADVNTGTCNYTTTEFYDLLRLCKEYFPESYSNEEEMDSALYVTGILGYASQFGETELSKEMTGETCVIGYPCAENVDGNGANLVFQDELSICANARNAVGACDFLKYVFSVEIQGSVSMFSPLKTVFEENESNYLKESRVCTNELSEQAMEYIYNASSVAVRKSPITNIVLEEAQAFFCGDKSAEKVAEIIQNRVEIYLAEQST